MDLDRDARRVLELARQQRTPTDADRTRVAHRLALGLGLSAGAAATAAAQVKSSALAAKTAASVAALKWSIAGTVLVAVATGGYLASAGRVPPAATQRVAIAQQARPASRHDALVPAPAAQPLPAAHAEVAHVPRAHAAEHSRRASSDAQLAQVELLHAAQAAWRAGNASTALSLVAQHRARWPRSSLRLERDALQVLALCDVGKQAEASRIARRLLARDHGSPLRAAIEDSCAFE